MLEAILSWICTQILNYLFNKASVAADKAAAQVIKDKERNETNSENLAAYENAKSREESRKAALDLLNRNKRS